VLSVWDLEGSPWLRSIVWEVNGVRRVGKGREVMIVSGFIVIAE